MNFADNLKKIRKENNLSQEQLAEKLGISRQAVSKWESGQSYPEMDKVVQICQLFDVNMDELINEDITKAKDKKEETNNTNKYIKSFFDYITKVVDMFSSMKFKQILLCLIEQGIIILIIVGIMFIIGGIGSSIVSDMLMILPSKVYYPVYHVFSSIFCVVGGIICTVIYLHIFKIRYLDYYEIVKVKDKEENNDDDEAVVEESTTEEKESSKEDKVKDKSINTIYLEKRPEKVIIRDPKHSEFSFISGLAKCILWFIKFNAFFIMIGIAFVLIAFTMCFAMSFVIIKSGFLFWGLILTFIGCIAITAIILELIYDFIVDKKINKTKTFILGICSLLLIGFGIGSSIISLNNFEYIEKEVELVKENYTFEMKDNLYFEYTYWYNDGWNRIEYIEKNIDNVEMVVEHSKYLEIGHNFDEINSSISFYLHSNEVETYDIIKEVIKGLNDKKIYNYNFDSKIIVYANKENIDKLKQNYNLHSSRVNYLEKRIDELSEENNILKNYILNKNNVRVERDKSGNIINVYEITYEDNEE